jgi:hypothetical protein
LSGVTDESGGFYRVEQDVKNGHNLMESKGKVEEIETDGRQERKLGEME